MTIVVKYCLCLELETTEINNTTIDGVKRYIERKVFLIFSVLGGEQEFRKWNQKLAGIEHKILTLEKVEKRNGFGGEG